MKIKIDVTQEDIDKGEQGTPNACPIALACVRAGYTNPDVDGLCISITAPDGGRVHAVTPKVATLFVEYFDGGLEVEPFSFEIDADEIL